MIKYATGYWIRGIAVGAGILSISGLHQATPLASLHWHNVYQHLYYLPIVFAGLTFGWIGGLAAGMLAGISNAPHNLASLSVAPSYAVDQILDVPIFCAAGVLTGVLAERGRKQRADLERTTNRLSEVYQQLQDNFELMKRSERLFAALVLPMLLVAGERQQAGQSDVVVRGSLKIFAPLPEVVPGASGMPSKDQIDLGRMLYFDPRLSKSQTISCNTCHPVTKYGADGEATSEGYRGQRGDRNAPTVYNAAGHFAQFWDGRAADLEEQAKGPVRNPVEMAMASEEEVIAVLRSMPDYELAFRRAFPLDREPVSFDNMANAIAAFERKLLTPSRWDWFLRGHQTALTAEEKTGLNTFLAAGCQTCHAGAFLGGSSFQKLGVVQPYPDTSDPGRYKVTENEADRMFFKVPSLRNVAMTAPYFHNGKVESLEEAVRQMSAYQRGKHLSETEVRSIVTWLRSLTGDLPSDLIRQPVLPKSTRFTPQPETGE